MKKTNNKNGFTIVEIIFAISALALVGGFVLQVFILATKVNNKAIDKQYSIVESSNVIEVLKSLNSIDEIYEDEYFSKSSITEKNNKITINGIYQNSEINTIAEITFSNSIYYVKISSYKDDKLIIDDVFASVIYED